MGLSLGLTIFVDGALPGELVKVRVIERKKRYAVARLLSIITPSPDRVVPPCPLFGKCGGCQIMHLSYEGQLKIKKQKVIDALTRIGKIENPPVRDCIPSPLPLAYRNKIQLPVREGPSLGLYAKGSHDLIEVDHCLIHCEQGENVFAHIKKLLKNSSLEPFDSKTGLGELRHVLIKSAIHTKQTLVILVTNQQKSPQLAAFAKAISPFVSGVIHNIHQESNNVILGDTYHTLEGSSQIQETLCGLTFSISPASFFQVNPLQAENLYLKALELADIQPNETVLDAYCGVGTLSLLFARKAKLVIGVECVPEAIRNAQENAKLNHIHNVTFFCDHAESFIKKSPAIDTLLLNPPRKGCDPSFLAALKKLLPKKIIYISCDPATLARDLAYLQQLKYNIHEVQPLDMFPQTSHVECITKLSF